MSLTPYLHSNPGKFYSIKGCACTITIKCTFRSKSDSRSLWDTVPKEILEKSCCLGLVVAQSTLIGFSEPTVPKLGLSSSKILTPKCPQGRFSSPDIANISSRDTFPLYKYSSFHDNFAYQGETT